MIITEKALEQYRAHDPHWSAELMAALEDLRSGLSLEWGIECAKSLVSHAAPLETRGTLLTWLNQLLEFKQTANALTLLEKSEVIWHEQRDYLHTAIAHLYAGVAFFLQSNTARYRTLVIWALNVMGDHEFYRQTSVAIPIALFEKFASARTRPESGQIL